jgi:hypothetical protein
LEFIVKYLGGPASLLLSRQKLLVLKQTDSDHVAHAGSVLLDADVPVGGEIRLTR